ncbi:MAG: hypothetical protein J6S67_17210 [Methanobrevibacter sp.]|nr:hypothetical protein [Methanobrevibacter sp.]
MYQSPLYPTNACVYAINFDFEETQALGFKIIPVTENKIRYMANGIIGAWQSTLNEIYLFPYPLTLTSLILELTDLSPVNASPTEWKNLTLMQTKKPKLQSKQTLNVEETQANKQTLPLKNPTPLKTYVKTIEKQANMPRFDIGYSTTRGSVISLEELNQMNTNVQVRKEPLDYSQNYQTDCQLFPVKQGLAYFTSIESISLIC